MTQDPDYRLFLQERFDRLNEKLDTIVTQTTKTNNRVTHLEEKSNERQVVIDDFRHLEKDFDCVKRKVDEIDKNLLEVWFFKKYPKVFIGILTAAVLATLGISFFNKIDMKEIRTKVNYIEAYEKIPSAPTRGAVNLPDSLHKDTIKK
jgi:hypothetical protein